MQGQGIMMGQQLERRSNLSTIENNER
jgi:hypothetical protein